MSGNSYFEDEIRGRAGWLTWSAGGVKGFNEYRNSKPVVPAPPIKRAPAPEPVKWPALPPPEPRPDLRRLSTGRRGKPKGRRKRRTGSNRWRMGAWGPEEVLMTWALCAFAFGVGLHWGGMSAGKATIVGIVMGPFAGGAAVFAVIMGWMTGVICKRAARAARPAWNRLKAWRRQRGRA